MQLKMLEHVNIRTADLEKLEAWYGTILDLKKGYRPPFQERGAWLYAGDWPMVHLLELAETPSGSDPKIEHFAIRATGLKDLISRLESQGIPYEPVRVPELRILQINFADPDGNHVHIDFPPEEADELGFA